MTEETLEELKDKAREMDRYYLKGIGNTFTGILYSAELYVISENEEEKEKASKDFKTRLGKIEGFCKTIPFEDLHGEEEYYPLFVINQMLPRLKESLNDFLERDREYVLEKRGGFFEKKIITAAELGALYHDNIKEVFEQIRSRPGGEDFEMENFDIKGYD